jgi:hypothetical protein
VDSVTPAVFVKHKKSGKTLWDVTVERFGRQPQFWGRYLNAENDSLTPEEVDYLHGRKCRIVPIFLIDKDNIKTEVVGKRNAQSAISRLTSLKSLVPNTIFIYADIEWDYKPGQDWIRGWWGEMKTWMGVGCGGFYCTPEAINHNFPDPYCKAVKAASEPMAFRRIWANSPDLKKMFYVPKGEFAPNGPVDLSKVEFKPNQPPCENVSAIWQYFANHGDQIPPDELPDLDLAIDEAWDRMWKPSLHVDSSSRQLLVDNGGDPAAAPGGGGGGYAEAADPAAGSDGGDPAAGSA